MGGVWEGERLQVDHDDFVVGEEEVGVLEDSTTGVEVQVGEREENVIDDGGAVNPWGPDTEGVDTGVGGVGRVSVWVSTVEDEEGGRSDKV